MESEESVLKSHGKTPQKGMLSKSYIIKKKLGKGNFAVVRLVERKSDGHHFAAKIIKKKNLKPDELATLTDEVEILRKLDHKNINKLIEIHDSKHHLYMVLELLTGGELFERIVSKKFYNEKDASTVVKQIAEACEYMHKRGVIHRDLKPENLVYLNTSETSPIKITDFGLAKMLQDQADLMKTACGTPGYVAPEILKQRKYDCQVDLWSIGVILYILLCGFPPFHEKTLRGLYRVIRKGQYSFPDPFWEKVSPEAKDCVKKLLVVDPEKRLTATQLLKHPWVTNTSSASPRNMAEESTGFRVNLRRTMLMKKLRNGVQMVIFLNTLKRQYRESESGDKPTDRADTGRQTLPGIDDIAEDNEDNLYR